MFLDANSLTANLDRIEEIEKASLRFVTHSIELFRKDAVEIFRDEKDLQADIGEDITRQALDRLGMSGIPQRVFGKMDYKSARYIYEADYALGQVLLVDSKAEKTLGAARIQRSQTSMRILRARRGGVVDEPGLVPKVAVLRGSPFLTTTIFVKYVYGTTAAGNVLRQIKIACLPNGLLQERYNPAALDTIWKAGAHSPKRAEKFRTRLSFSLLKGKKQWRVQTLLIEPAAPFVWDE